MIEAPSKTDRSPRTLEMPHPMQPLPEGYVAHFPKQSPQQIPHIFCDDIYIKPEDSQSHHEEVHRICAVCKCVRVTIMPKGQDAYREWREASGVAWAIGAVFGCARGGRG